MTTILIVDDGYGRAQMIARSMIARSMIANAGIEPAEVIIRPSYDPPEQFADPKECWKPAPTGLPRKQRKNWKMKRRERKRSRRK
ncbi:hypothetical protein [Oryzomonas rubra]|uniref:Uncharacterized protein n=1 Tax=Oryzomonas rubra TaxID=2509454 RepID=A0A5A9X7G4_9BACT|nr:hypothetical protein [Oryzomonas rubra]KAA0888734.1 hypothetical protein ET418_15250 [Oryzomonas rubra]